MAGFSNDTMFADNVNFAGGKTPTVTVDGQILIGSTVAPNIRVGTLASSDGSIVITTGAGTIDLTTAASVGAFTDIAVPTLAIADSGWFATAALTLTLPATAGLANGASVILICDTAGAVVIQAGAGQSIRVSGVVSAVAGTATSTSIGDSLELRFRIADQTWHSQATNGNWNVV